METSTGGLREHQAEWAQVVGQTQRMTSLIDDLLLLARTDAGRSSLAFETIDLASVVREAAAEIEIVAQASHLKLTTSIPSDCPMTGSPNALRRILLVLLDNAIKYTSAGGEITVRVCIAELHGNRRAIVEVCDTGVGIAPDDLPRIFDRFHRVSADRSRQSGGAGLGLSIAKSLAELHGGNIEAESIPGNGSVFRVNLPLI